MLTDGLSLLQGSTVTNLTIESGDTLPTGSNEVGKLFNRTGATAPGLYVYDGTSWVLSAGAAGPLNDGDYTDVEVSGSGAVITVKDTAPAIAAKVNSVDPQTSGIAQHSGAVTVVTTAPGGSQLNVAGAGQEFSFSASGSFTVNATPPDGRMFGPVWVSNTSGSAITMGLPAIGGLTWVDDNTGTAITEISVGANSRVGGLLVHRLGSQLRVMGLPVIGGGGGGYDTPAEVRDALQTLTGTDRLSATAIRDLPSSSSFALATIDHNGGGANPIVGDTLTATLASGWTAAGQWFRDNAEIVSATALTYLTEQAGDHNFRIVLGDATFTSNTLTVSAPPPPGGDMEFVQASAFNGDFGTDLTRTFGANSTVGNHILAAFIIANETSAVSGTSATVDASPVVSTENRAWALKTLSVGDAVTTRPYTLTPGWIWEGFAIEVSGDTPVFDSFYTTVDSTFSPTPRTIEITVAEDNSMVMVVITQQAARDISFSAGLTGVGNDIPDRYACGAWGKFDAGVHTLTITPSADTQFNAMVAFVWSPGS